MNRSAIVLSVAGLLAMTSVASACDKPSEAAAKSSCTAPAAKKAPAAQASAQCTSPAAAHCTSPAGASCCAAMAAKAAAPATAPAAAPANAGMRIYRDPVTGELSPTPVVEADAVKDADAATEDLRDPVQTVLPDGSVMVELNGHGQEYYIVKMDKDGNRTTECVQDPKAALKAPAKPAKPEDK